jgi:hypothetical protein
LFRLHVESIITHGDNVSKDGDPEKEADVIMTAAALGLAESYIAKTVGGVLILDAVTIHAGEIDRISRTLK